MKLRRFIIVFACVLALALASCGSYYKIADPTTGKTYYTTKIKQRSSALEFTDAATGSMVTIQNSEVTEISKEEFKANTPKK